MAKVIINGTNGITGYESDNVTVSLAKTISELNTLDSTTFLSNSSLKLDNVKVDALSSPAILRFADNDFEMVYSLTGTFIQSTRSSYNSSGNILSFSSALQAGDLVVACINNWAWSLGASTSVTLAAQATHQWNPSYASKAIIVYYIASGGETSLNAATHAVNCSSTSAVYRFSSPVQSVTVRDTYALNSPTAGNRTMSGASYAEPQIVVATKAKYSGTVTLTNSTGYDYEAPSSATTAEGLALYKINNTAANSLVTWSASATTGCVAACILEPTF